MTAFARRVERKGRKPFIEYQIKGTYPDGELYGDSPDGIRRKSHLPTVDATLRWAREKEREMLEQWRERRAEGFRAPPFGEAWADYMLYSRTVKRNMSATLKWKVKVHKSYLSPCISDDMRVDKIDEDFIDKIVATHHRLAPKTVNEAIGVLHSFLVYCFRKKKLHRVPHVEPLALEKRVPKRLVLDDYSKLLKACSALAAEGLWQPLVMCHLGGDCGLRMQETIALMQGDVDLVNGRIFVQRAWSDGAIVTTKGKRFRVVPIEPPMVKLLAQYQHAGRFVLHHDGRVSRWEKHNTRAAAELVALEVTPSTAYRWFLMAVERAEIAPQGRLHVLRHTFGSHLADAGVDAHRIKDLLGHANLSTSEVYIELAGTATRSATQQLEEHRRAAGEEAERRAKASVH